MTEPFDPPVGRVLARGLGAVGRDPAGTLSPAVLFGVIPSALTGYAVERVAPSKVWYALGEMPGEFAPARGARVLGCGSNLSTQGAVTRAVLARLAIGIGTPLGGLLLLLPGPMLFAAWSLAGPVLGLNAVVILTYVLFNAALFGAGVLIWSGGDVSVLDAPLPLSFWVASTLPLAVASAAWARWW